jgi:hypothetical protein
MPRMAWRERYVLRAPLHRINFEYTTQTGNLGGIRSALCVGIVNLFTGVNREGVARPWAWGVTRRERARSRRYGTPERDPVTSGMRKADGNRRILSAGGKANTGTPFDQWPKSRRVGFRALERAELPDFGKGVVHGAVPIALPHRGQNDPGRPLRPPRTLHETQESRSLVAPGQGADQKLREPGRRGWPAFPSPWST